MRRTDPICPDVEETTDHNGQDLNQLPAYDHLLNDEVTIQVGENSRTGAVKGEQLHHMVKPMKNWTKPISKLDHV